MRRSKNKNLKMLVKDVFSDDNSNKKTTNKLVKKVSVIFISLTILSLVVSYTLVLCKEDDVRKLHIKTSSVKMENIDMKSNVEFSKSLYNVESKASSISYLHKPEKIIEVDEKPEKIDINLNEYRKKPIERAVSGY